MVEMKNTLPRWRQQDSHHIHSSQPKRPRRSREWLGFGIAFALIYLWTLHTSWLKIELVVYSSQRNGYIGLPLKDIPPLLKNFQDCSIANLAATNLTFLDTASPLPVSEFVNRRDRLAQALHNQGLDAFLVEPGYTFSYYANVTQPDWEVWVRHIAHRPSPCSN